MAEILNVRTETPKPGSTSFEDRAAESVPKLGTEIPKPGSVSFEDRVTKSVPYEWGYGSTPRTAKLRDSL